MVKHKKKTAWKLYPCLFEYNFQYTTDLFFYNTANFSRNPD